MTSAVLRGIASCVLGAAALTGMPVAAQGAQCPAASVGGPTVGTVAVGDAAVPLKLVSYRDGGELLPPESNRNAGISTVNARIGAPKGMSVITWHARFGPGCPGALNDLSTMPIGTQFTVSMLSQAPVTYVIAERVKVRKGQYKAEWFSREGPHRLALFTCGTLRNGVFQSTIVTIADPVSPPIP